MFHFWGAVLFLAAPVVLTAEPEVPLFPHQQSKSVEIRSADGGLFSIQGHAGRIVATQVTCRTSQDAIACSNSDDLVVGLTLQIQAKGKLLFTFSRGKTQEVAPGRLELRWRPVYIAVLQAPVAHVANVPDRLAADRD